MKQKIKPVHLNFIILRHKLNISQAEYGDKLSISKNLVAAIESGRYQPRIEIKYKSFKLGNISKQDLYVFVFDFACVISG